MTCLRPVLQFLTLFCTRKALKSPFTGGLALVTIPWYTTLCVSTAAVAGFVTWNLNLPFAWSQMTTRTSGVSGPQVVAKVGWVIPGRVAVVLHVAFVHLRTNAWTGLLPSAS